MCRDHFLRESLGGALAVLNPSLPEIGINSVPMAGRLVFHDRGKGSLMATHAMFTADSPGDLYSHVAGLCLVRIQ
jgi:hypothetical protein